MNILSVDKDNILKSKARYNKYRQYTEEFYQLCLKYENKVAKLKLLGQWEKYILVVKNKVRLIKNVAEGDKWGEYNIIYCPEGINALGVSLCQINCDKVLIIGFAEIEEFCEKCLNIIRGTSLILACKLSSNIETYQMFAGVLFRHIILYGRVYNKEHELSQAFNPSSLRDTFSVSIHLETVTILDGDYSRLESLRSAFRYCISLHDVYLENIEGAKIKYIDSIFDNCMSIREANLSALNVDECRSFSNIFYSCIGLRYVDINTWKLDEEKFNDIFKQYRGIIKVDHPLAKIV